MNWFEELLNKLVGGKENIETDNVKVKKSSKPIIRPKTEKEAEDLIEEILKKK